jgi:hypothetical protein
MNRDNRMGLKNRHSRGQALVLVSLMSSLLFGLTGLVVDMGRVYSDQSVLNASTQAAALAGAYAMAQAGASTTSVTTAVTNYTSESGDKNVSAFLSGATLATGYPIFACLTTVTNSFGTQCYGPSSSNAIVVKQKASVPVLFLRIFGTTAVEVSSLATASMKGAVTSPYNLAIVIDTTASMNNTDSGSGSDCNNTRISCALSGVQILLKSLSPCLTSETTCGTVTAGMVANSVDRVSMFVFPPVTTATVADDYNCGSTNPTITSYATPFPGTSTYQVIPFSSDYRTSDTATSLRTASHLGAAVVGTSGTPCLKAVGGEGTFYAQAIYAAQAALVTEQGSFANSKNVMIILSDGDANATSAHMPGASTTTGTYISTLQQCHQAVTAAQAAATAGTLVYTVAYGAAASGCATDTSPSITPCQTMEHMASNSAYFYSDYAATGGTNTCISASQPVTSLSQIFQVIAGDLTVARLIPNGTT